MPRTRAAADPLAFAHPVVRRWFEASFAAPTEAQRQGWPPIVASASTLLLAPTGSGKTLAAFLVALQRLMFPPPAAASEPGVRVLYISPLQALGVDVERNLRAPLAGIAAEAGRQAAACREVSVGIRTGDTPPRERARLVRHPPDILITTPESLYLMLTSNADATLRRVETVIVDEIHSLVASKRGAHLFVSLERLERLRGNAVPLQRIGLSATQRPLDEIAHLLGGAELPEGPYGPVAPRPVTVVDAGRRKPLELLVEVPVEDMSRLGEPDDEIASGPAAAAPPARSIWPSIHPRLVELIRAHRSTMIFANSRRLAERLAGALNELAGEELAQAHHGSIAKDQRQLIEDRLKRGDLPAIVATSSLELGIDMGAVDLVVQIEAPPSVASGIQRIGRAGHSVGEVSRGVVFPKYRADLLACAAAVPRMQAGDVEPTHYPRNPLDVLAQQVVAIVSRESLAVDELYGLVRRAAPFAELPRSSFETVLDMLSGRFPSERFAGLRARITWDRIAGRLEPRRGARNVAVTNAGTIPDRGLYGVFLAGAEGRTARVGELDEEMVFESKPGDVFVLGASSWRIEEITHDRVVVVPAPGEPGRMPFWHGDRPGRPPEFGRAIGALTRELAEMPAPRAEKLLRARHGLDERAARNLVAYLAEQREATGELPTDRTLVLELFLDEVGDWRLALLSPFGARVHAPWAIAVAARLREELGLEPDTLWTDDGIVFRLPETDEPPDAALFLPATDEVERLVTAQLGRTALFAARFRESAARALLLPRRRPGQRTPLWIQRRRSSDLLGVAADFSDFPIVLEAYRECLRDVFDLPGLVELLGAIADRRLRVRTVRTRIASPFAASLLFSYVANFLYEGDAPLAERRAQALSLDHAQLRELMGDPALREMLEPDAIEQTVRRLQRLDPEQAIAHADGLHDLLLALGDLTRAEIGVRATDRGAVAGWLDELLARRRAIEVTVAAETRVAAAEHAGLLRDALGVVPPRGLPQAFLEPVPRALEQLLLRWARWQGPFRAEEPAERYGLGLAPVTDALARLAEEGRLVEGEFLPGGRGREWCDPEVLRAIKQRSLAHLRRQVEPVEPAALGRFLVEWQGLGRPRRGADGLLAVIEQLQGAPLLASALETHVLPARVVDYEPALLDELCATGEVVWRGLEPLAPRDGRIALFVADHVELLAPPSRTAEGRLTDRLRVMLAERGASFFGELVRETEAFPPDLLDTLWDLVWSGEATNDTLVPLRSLLRGGGRSGRAHPARPRRRAGPPGSEGRWSLVRPPRRPPAPTERATALVNQLLERHGVLTREALQAENIPGSFAALYPVLRAMEDAGRLRRGYFVSGLGAAQFGLPGAADRLRRPPDEMEPRARDLVLASADPANPYGAALAWPDRDDEGARPQRAAGAEVVLIDGALAGWRGRAGNTLVTFLPGDEPERSAVARRLAAALARRVDEGGLRAMLIERIDGAPAGDALLARFLLEEGFQRVGRGLLHRRGSHPPYA
jgi:ATP-dependent Lhr-like helicase